MAFEDLRTFMTAGIDLPIDGKVYHIPSPNAHEGLRIRRFFSDDTMSLNDSQEVDEIMKLLGATWHPNLVEVSVVDPITGDAATREVDRGHYSGGLFDEMATDGVTWPEIMHAGRVALIDIGLGRVVAETAWATRVAGSRSNPLPADPGASVDWPAQKKRPAKKAPAKKTAPRKTTARKKATR